jgi:hypothetical protein
MNVGYFCIPHNSNNSFINMEILEKQELIRNTGYIRHIRFENPLTILMDGRKRQAVIRFNEEHQD